MKIEPHVMTNLAKLRFNENLSVRQIAQNLNISPSTVSRVLTELSKAGINEDNYALFNVDVLFAKARPKAVIKYLEPNFSFISEQLKINRKMTLQQAWENIYKQVPVNDGKYYSYQRFCALYKDWNKQQKEAGPAYTSMPINPGEYLEIDFSGDDLFWYDTKGEKYKGRVFVASLRYSKLIFCKVFEDESQGSWIDGIISAFNYIGGVTLSITVDNARALVKKPDRYVGEVTCALNHLCKHYKTEVHTSPARTPTFKPEAERAALLEQRHVRALMGGANQIVAKNISDLNARMEQAVNEFNLRPFTDKSKGSRRSLFETKERPLLNKLPILPYHKGEWKILKANSEYMLKLNNKRYMIPYQYASQYVAVRIVPPSLEIFDINTSRLIAQWSIDYSPEYASHSRKEFMSPLDLSYRGSYDDVMNAFKLKYDISNSDFSNFIKVIFDKDLPVMNRTNKIRSIKGLIHKHGKNLVIEACKDLIEDNQAGDLQELRNRILEKIKAINTTKSKANQKSEEKSSQGFRHTTFREFN